MTKTILSLAFTILCLALSGQNIKLTQQKLNDDFLIKNGQYKIYFHKADVLQTMDEIDKKLKTDNAKIRGEISSGKIKDVDITPASSSDKTAIKLVKSSLGSYLLLKGKAVVYKGNQQLTGISVEEAPPEAELDGTMSNIYFFGEIGTSNWIFNGGIRTELRK